MSINERIKEIRVNYCNDSNKLFSEKLLVSRQAANNYVRDGYNIGRDVIEKILLSFPKVDANWLLTGKGDMLKHTYSVQEDKSLVLNEPLQPFGRKDELNEIKDKYIIILEENRELRIENEKMKCEVEGLKNSK